MLFGYRLVLALFTPQSWLAVSNAVFAHLCRKIVGKGFCYARAYNNAGQ